LPGISIREFARREGISHTAVQKAVATGHLSRLHDGKIDDALVGTGWRAANRKAGKLPDEVAGADAVAAEIASRAAAGKLLSIADAEQLKENYLARLRQLEYDTKAGAVVPAADVADLVTREYAAVRTRLLAIPAELAPRLHRLKTLPEIQAALSAAVTEALEELTGDGDGPRH